MRIFYNDVPYEMRVIYSYDTFRIRKIIFYGLNFLDPDPKYDGFTLFAEHDLSSIPRAVSVLSEVGELELVQMLLNQYREYHFLNDLVL